MLGIKDTVEEDSIPSLGSYHLVVVVSVVESDEDYGKAMLRTSMEAQSRAPDPPVGSEQSFLARRRVLAQTQKIGKGQRGGHA